MQFGGLAAGARQSLRGVRRGVRGWRGRRGLVLSQQVAVRAPAPELGELPAEPLLQHVGPPPLPAHLHLRALLVHLLRYADLLIYRYFVNCSS